MWRSMVGTGRVRLRSVNNGIRVMAMGLMWTSVAAVAHAEGMTPQSQQQIRQALEVLLGGDTPSQMVNSQALHLPSLQTVTVRRGETLDGVIRRTLAHLPFKDDFLRTVFVAVNPTAFVAGSPHRLKAGAVLQVPSLQDVRRVWMQQAGIQEPESLKTASPSAHTGSVTDPRQDWVRFP